MDRFELTAWLRLVATPHLSREAARRLLAALGSPSAVFAAPEAAVREIVGPGPAAAVASPPVSLDSLVQQTSRWLEAEGAEPRHLITLADTSYPAALLQTADPPLLLHVRGSLRLLQARSLAVVGSRNPTAQGLDNARQFARSLSSAGYPIVSGLALGIDGAAHEGGLEGGAGTIAVLGTGPDQVYPKRHARLAQRILEAPQGALVSEYVLGTPPLPAYFPPRNRIIAGLSLGTLVVEATLQSGSLITARLASEAGREVFAIPGSIHAPQSRGCHALIKQGAKLVERAEDVVEEFSAVQRRLAFDSGIPSPPADADPLLAALGFDPVSLDALVARTGESAHTLSARLLELELAGRVARLPGQLFQRCGLG